MSAAPATTTGGSRRRVALDRLTDALTPAEVRRRFERAQRALGITRFGWVAVAGAVLLWLAAYIVAGTAMYLFAYGMVLLLVLAVLLAPRRLKLEGERDGLYPRVQEGDRLDVEVKLTARRRMSTFILEERVPERLGRAVRVPITKLSSGSTVSHHYGLRASRRGVYQVGPLVAVAGDPLGLIQRETVVAEPFELLVHPRVETVSDRPLTRQFEDPPIRPPVSKPLPSGLEFYGMREYVPGDDLRRIVWRASARTGKVMVREAEQGITDRITIMIDTDRGAHSRDGEGLSESFEAGIRVAASLGVRHLREGYEVRAETNGGPLTRPLRGATHQLVLLDALARLELSREPMASMFMRLLSGGRRDAHNILITPRLGQAEAAQLKLLLDTGASVLVVALLWDEASTDTMGIAAGLGCQVVGVHPGQDLATALYSEVAGSGARR
ncbi:MAG: DUF58 domain-containing protein [Actinobacteria bacterium]|nr:DUF58 domain-containing protein [Actinomycetota bacterium]MBV9253133.1 DUF58 domain-containing protein [Actinomycetota bacterium]